MKMRKMMMVGRVKKLVRVKQAVKMMRVKKTKRKTLEMMQQ